MRPISKIDRYGWLTFYIVFGGGWLLIAAPITIIILVKGGHIHGGLAQIANDANGKCQDFMRSLWSGLTWKKN